MEKIIEQANQTRSDFPFVPASEQIHRHAIEQPEKTAVIVSGRKISYAELDKKSNCVANVLLSRHLDKDTLVGVLLERSEYAYYAEQGILKAHAAFLPFITSYPDDRISFCMEDGDVPVLLTSRKVLTEHDELSDKGFEIICMEDIPGICSTYDESLTAYPSSDDIGKNDLAYCIYTSGSTGRPKGVLIEQGNLANYVQRDEKSIEIMHYASPGMVSLAMAAFSFDVSIVEQFVPLCNGNTVCMATDEEIHNPLLLAKAITDSGVTGITCTPTFLVNIVDMDICREALRQIRFYDIGAEAFPSGLYSRLREIREDSIILNVYGPTECTMGCSSAVMEDDGDITIGGPMVNTCFYVMNDKGEELNVGEKGELIICGDCVGRGYVKLPEKTAKAFFTYQGMRAYHSGDLASWTSDGRIQIWGRIDNQIKLRGFRIELDEIEQVMSTYPTVKGSAVKLCHGKSDYLAGYLTASAPLDMDEVRTFLRQQLPEYMIPAVITQLDTLPETVNGKVDRKALPDVEPTASVHEMKAPHNDMERQLRDAFAEVLHMDQEEISITDDFFELGGDSLKSMMLLSRLQPLNIMSSDIFSLRTIERIAAMLQEKKQGKSLDEIEEQERKRPHRLSMMQTKMVDFQFVNVDSTMWNNMYYLFRFNRKTDAKRLCQAVNDAIRNHPALSMRISFDDEGHLVQTYHPELTPEVILEPMTDIEVVSMADSLVEPFSIFNSPLLRVRMFQTDRYAYLFFDVHHLLMDGSSLSIVLADVVRAYKGEPLPKDYYCTYLATEERLHKSQQYQEDKAYFQSQYGGYDWCTVPAPVKEGMRKLKAGRRVVRLPFDAEDLEAAESRLNSSRSVIAITAGLLALHKMTGKNDVMTNWIFNNRLGSFATDSVGMLIKNLPVGLHMDQIHSVEEALAEVKKQVTDGITHCSYDFFANSDSPFYSDPMEVNYQLNINADELDELYPFHLELSNTHQAPGARLELEFLENDDNSGRFDSEMEWAANCFQTTDMINFHQLYIHYFESIVLG